jgi:type I restriction enzyme, S subunit
MSDFLEKLDVSKVRRFKPYSAYKSSSVEWLGDVPNHWEVKAIKWESSVLRGASPRPIDDPVYFDDEGEYAWVRISDVTNAGAYLKETTQRLSLLGSSLSVRLFEGQLFLSIAGSVGKPCIAAMKCCIHDGFVYFPFWKGDSRFLYYMFASGEPYKGLGKLGTQLNLNTDTVGAIRAGFPPTGEQSAIADFLDRETAKIDTLIAKKQTLIERLKEKRSALISDLVTRGLPPDAARAAGLDPHPALKPSGIEWLGDVPAHWSVKPLKRVCTLIKDGTHLPPARQSDGIPLLSVRNVVDGVFRFLSDDSMISEDDYDELCRAFVVKEKDVLLAIVGATMGKVAIVPKMGRFHIQRSLAVFRCRSESADYRFLAAWLRSSGFQDLLWVSVAFSAQPGVYLGTLKDFPFLAPPLIEQVAIVAYLDREIAKLDALMANVKEAIVRMREYRTALITAAVTGKIDVRGAVA